jgi:hypothetical protein
VLLTIFGVITAFSILHRLQRLISEGKTMINFRVTFALILSKIQLLLRVVIYIVGHVSFAGLRLNTQLVQFANLA